MTEKRLRAMRRIDKRPNETSESFHSTKTRIAAGNASPHHTFFFPSLASQATVSIQICAGPLPLPPPVFFRHSIFSLIVVHHTRLTKYNKLTVTPSAISLYSINTTQCLPSASLQPHSFSLPYQQHKLLHSLVVLALSINPFVMESPKSSTPSVS